jgi:hypothetical protein
MAHAIPKIHFNQKSIVGNSTNLSATLTGVLSTVGLENGMVIEGTGIPANTSIVSFTSSTITMSNQASANQTGATFSAYKKIEFDYPPIENSGERINPQERRNVSLSGITQTSIDHIEASRTLNFSFLSETKFQEIKAFFQTWAVYGESFDYFEDKTLTSFLTYEIKNFDFSPVKIAPKGTGYVWAVPLQIRRVI